MVKAISAAVTAGLLGLATASCGNMSGSDRPSGASSPSSGGAYGGTSSTPSGGSGSGAYGSSSGGTARGDSSAACAGLYGEDLRQCQQRQGSGSGGSSGTYGGSGSGSYGGSGSSGGKY